MSALNLHRGRAVLAMLRGETLEAQQALLARLEPSERDELAPQVEAQNRIDVVTVPGSLSALGDKWARAFERAQRTTLHALAACDHTGAITQAALLDAWREAEHELGIALAMSEATHREALRPFVSRAVATPHAKRTAFCALRLASMGRCVRTMLRDCVMNACDARGWPAPVGLGGQLT